MKNICATFIAKIWNIKVIVKTNLAHESWSKNFIKNKIYNDS